MPLPASVYIEMLPDAAGDGQQIAWASFGPDGIGPLLRSVDAMAALVHGSDLCEVAMEAEPWIQFGPEVQVEQFDLVRAHLVASGEAFWLRLYGFSGNRVLQTVALDIDAFKAATRRGTLLFPGDGAAWASESELARFAGRIASAMTDDD